MKVLLLGGAGHVGVQNEREHNLSKAKRVLGWEPRSHRLLGQERCDPDL